MSKFPETAKCIARAINSIVTEQLEATDNLSIIDKPTIQEFGSVINKLWEAAIILGIRKEVDDILNELVNNDKSLTKI